MRVGRKKGQFKQMYTYRYVYTPGSLLAAPMNSVILFDEARNCDTPV